MTEEEVKLATCQILTQNESGTGWLISPDHVLTAYHCVSGAIVEGEPINIRFGVGDSASEQKAIIESADDDLDVCLLRLSEPLHYCPIPIDSCGLWPGERWYAFGYPAVKLDVGHVLQGNVQQVLSERVHGIDLDLSVEPDSTLSDYRGLSGAALMAGTRCFGVICVNIDNSIGAVSFKAMADYLRSNGFLPEEIIAPEEEPPVATRPDFDALLEDSILNKRGGYLFLDGSHGIGKSTYCKRFLPKVSELEVLGNYAFTAGKRGSTPARQAQPEVFFDWLLSLLSRRATGNPARLAEYSYAQLIEKTSEVLHALAGRCVQTDKVGILFIDGINEIANAANDGLKRFVDMLPATLPDGLVVVITGVGLEALATNLGNLAKGSDRLTLPALTEEIQQKFCYSTLKSELASPRLIAAICDRAKGHPLYLRYLVDLVNGGASTADIAAIPPFSGAIEDYYESIWSHLLIDNDAINLLGIMARLRWGIRTQELMPMLTSSECAALIPALNRIRHLLSSPDKTEIYHPSFAEFILQKTQTLSEWIHGRLADFCLPQSSGNYGKLNKVYHGLRGESQRESSALEECQQQWVDQSVMLGVEPDILLADIGDALAASTRRGPAVDIIRLLLLSQRLKFRYNTLFAQSAELVGQALIALGQTEQALRHIIRSGHLIVDLGGAFVLARSLIQANKLVDAFTVLEAIDLELVTVLSSKEINARDFFTVASCRLHEFALNHLAGGDASSSKLFRAIGEGVLFNPQNDFPEKERQAVLQELLGSMLGSELCLEGKYKPISQIDLPADIDRHHLLKCLLSTLEYAATYAYNYGIRMPKEKVALLLSDIASTLDSSLPVEDRSFSVINRLIMAGASTSLVETYADGVALNAIKISFFTKSKAIPDEHAFNDSYQRFRTSYFLGEQCIQPVPQMATPETWENSIESLARGTAWCDGRARRGKVLEDRKELEEIKGYIKDNLLPCLAFPLASRMRWEESYAIPENIIPLLYEHITSVYLDCFPEEIATLLDVIQEGFDAQLGLYNEGFRRVLRAVIVLCLEADINEAPADTVFGLLCRWRDYVQEEIQNRHERVPELLHMVPLFARLGSTDEARKTYEAVLSSSMGPNWYKEDQLSLMSSALRALPPDAELAPSTLSQIAAYLEQAGGEMTFQRYVRHEKGVFVGELCRHGLYADGVRYFKHQSCGTTEELFEQVSQGKLDRITPFVGMRFPGGALDEQAALLELLKNTGGLADWRLGWALLEIYQHGDERYLEDWGQTYAEIIQRISPNPDELNWAVNRVGFISQTMSSKRAFKLMQGLVQKIHTSDPVLSLAFLDRSKALFTDEQQEQFASWFDQNCKQDDEVETTEIAIDQDAGGNNEDDFLLVPGTFGRMSAINEAKRALNTAESHAKRRNTPSAIEESIIALKGMQKGEWSIWVNNHSARAADKLISQLVPSADEIVRLYGPLVLEERNTPHWCIAEHLINLIGVKLENSQQTLMLSIVLDHIKEIVGSSPSDAFSYIGNAAPCTASTALFELILWTLDHPSRERRDTAAEMLLWLLESSDIWTEDLLHLAVSMDSRNRSDIASNSLDILSVTSPAEFWLRIAPYVDAEKIIQECQHVGRFITFLQIAERASQQGSASATEVAKTLRSRVNEKTSRIYSPTVLPAPKYLPPSLVRAWRDLTELGVLTNTAIERFESELAATCLPLEIDETLELERLVANGARDQLGWPTGRWACKVCYALQVALFPDSSVEKMTEINDILSV